MKRLFVGVLALFSLSSLACDHWAEATYVSEPPPPAPDSLGPTEALVVAEGAAVGVVFHLYRGGETATKARTIDGTIVQLREAESGHAYVLVGLAPGKTEIEVSRDDDVERVGVRVVAQEP